MAIKLGDLLLKAKVITEQQLKAALDEQKKWGGKLGEILVRMTFINEDLLVKALSKQLNVARVDLDALQPVPKPVLHRIPHDMARDLQVVALQLGPDKTLTVAMVDPSNLNSLDTLRKVSRCKIQPVIAGATSIARMIARSYEDELVDGNLGTEGDSQFKVVDASGRTVVRSVAELEARGVTAAAKPPEARKPPLPSPPPPPVAEAPAPKAGGPSAVLAQVEEAQRREVQVLKAVVELLIEKGVITRDEYIARVRR